MSPHTRILSQRARALAPALLGGLLVATLAACGGDDDAAGPTDSGSGVNDAVAVDAPGTPDGTPVAADAAAGTDALGGPDGTAAAPDAATRDAMSPVVDAGPGVDRPVGADCDADAQCVTGVCWDFHDYDPFCFGAVCSGSCETTEDCKVLAADAGAGFPENAQCGADKRCDLVGTGLGAFACALSPGT